MNPRDRRGFTLLEMVIAVTILAGILVGVAVMLHSTGKIATLEAARNEIERVNQKALDQMALELRDAAARITTVAFDGTSVQFQIPVPPYDTPLNLPFDPSDPDEPANKPTVDATGATRFGFLEVTGKLQRTPRDGTITYQFVPDTRAGLPEVVSEAALRMNLNADGDSIDQFVVGRIVRITQVTGQAAVTDPGSMGIWIAQPFPIANLGGDVSGDGQPDPIFQLDAANSRIIVNLWAVHVDGNKNPHFVRSTTSIGLRNR